MDRAVILEDGGVILLARLVISEARDKNLETSQESLENSLVISAMRQEILADARVN